MSDRCYMTIQCAKKDYDEVLHEYFPEVSETEGEFVCASAPEADYAYADEVEEWSKQGMVFIAFHDVGGNYGAYEIASEGKELREQPYHRDHRLVAPLNDTTGKPDSAVLEQAQEFLKVRRRAQEYLNNLHTVG